MKTPSKSFRILSLIAASPNGLSFGEIQRTLWKMSHTREFRPDVDRGYWCTNLIGGPTGGLLYMYCWKAGKDGRWRFNGDAVPVRPWSGR